MSKLLKLRPWLTLAEAAGRLTASMQEPVAEADLLHAALDGHLRLSVHIPRPSPAWLCSLVPAESVGLKPLYVPGMEVLPPSFLGPPLMVPDADPLPDGRFIRAGNEIETISGTWDLLLAGQDRQLIAEHIRELTGQAVDTGQRLDAIYLLRQTDGEDEYACLATLRSRDEDLQCYQRSWQQAHDNDTPPEEQQRLRSILPALIEQAQQRLDDLGIDHLGIKAENWPADAALVVRTSALLAFEQTILMPDSQPIIHQELKTRERNTLLSLIAALIDDIGIPIGHGAGAEIARITEKFGMPIGEDTINDKLRQVDALVKERRNV